MTETTVIIAGGATNTSFVLDLLEQPEVIDASADTGWIDRVRGEGRLVAQRGSAVALAVAAIEAYEDAEGLMTEPLPNCRSIWSSAVSRAFSLSPARSRLGLLLLAAMRTPCRG